MDITQARKEYQHNFEQAVVPDHVPRDLISDFNLFYTKGMNDHPQDVLGQLHSGRPVFFAPYCHRGLSTWFLIKNEDIKWVLRNPEIFSSKGNAGFAQMAGEDWDLIPLELDPPDHKKYRDIIGPFFSPQKIAELDEQVRVSARSLVEEISLNGNCEFVSAFSKPFPVRIVLTLLGLPYGDFDRFMEWVEGILHQPDMEIRKKSAASILAYVTEYMDIRKVDKGNDLMSLLLSAEVDGRPLTENEVLRTFFFIFVAGLDTVTSSLGFIFRYLAENPGAQLELRNNPDSITSAIEELFRMLSPVVVHRRAMADIDHAGVSFKKGDWLTLLLPAANRDPEAFSNPENMDFSRSPNHHMAFNFGPHRCLGSHLARREVRIALEEWFRHIPLFTLKPDAPVEVHGGTVFGVDRMVLCW